MALDGSRGVPGDASSPLRFFASGTDSGEPGCRNRHALFPVVHRSAARRRVLRRKLAFGGATLTRYAADCRVLVGVRTPRRRSWGSRPFAALLRPAGGWPSPANLTPPAVTPNIHRDAFLSRDRSVACSNALGHPPRSADDRSWMLRTGFWDVSRGPAAPPDAQLRAIHQRPLLPWAWPPAGLRASTRDALRRARPHRGHQPPPTASGGPSAPGPWGSDGRVRFPTQPSPNRLISCRPFSVFEGLMPGSSSRFTRSRCTSCL